MRKPAGHAQLGVVVVEAHLKSFCVHTNPFAFILEKKLKGIAGAKKGDEKELP